MFEKVLPAVARFLDLQIALSGDDKIVTVAYVWNLIRGFTDEVRTHFTLLRCQSPTSFT